MALMFPDWNPIAFQIGPVAVRWYGLAYLGGFLGAWRWALWILPHFWPRIIQHHVDDFFTWALLGVVLGGRLGYFIFYNPQGLWQDWTTVFAVWRGGMAFHGGCIGFGLACFIYCRFRHIPILPFADLCVCGVPIGLFLGRVANFINQEVYGRITQVPWGVIFPQAGSLPRHPSQLYEAALEGIILWSICFVGVRKYGWARYPGRCTGFFLLGYGCVRWAAEYFREPEVFFTPWIMWGQILSLPLLVFGGVLLYRSSTRLVIPQKVD